MPKNNKRHQPHPFLPQGLLKFFAVAALLLVPWTLIVFQSLPSDHLSRHWNQAWVGFDLGLVIFLSLTAILGIRKSGWVIVTASAAGTLLLVDAWFDCLTAVQGNEAIISYSSAICIELPMAVMAFWISYCAGKHFINRK